MANKSYNDIVDDFERSLPERLLSVREPSQRTLLLKAVATRFFEANSEDCFTFRDGDKFGFNERLVNQLIEVAYNLGAQSIDHNSYQKGYNDCWAEVLRKLDIEDE